ncbi:energy-coupling factor ABC transporter permease [Streptomyces alboflavus]|uniref:energy-coupling factor ABC transporter permease n=1 Tax=Streptomyces alboflavus TaxID=67267 RepID=UPI0036B0B5E6
MHVPDGFINAPVSVAAGAVAVGAVAVSLRGARREQGGTSRSSEVESGGERTAPLAGLVAAFIFAVQMLNFPVAAGTSGHLLGGALAAILVGPYTAVLCVSVVLLMQGLLFADGGLTALGVNITVMACVTTVVAYVIFRGLAKVLPRGRRSVTAAAFTAALVSVPAAAAAFTLLYAVGGTTDVPLGKVATAMIGVHVLIGIGEAAITALTVGAVIAVRPDLVHGARGLTAPLKLRVGGELVDAPATPAPAPAAAGSHRKLWAAGLVTSLILAGFVSFYASTNPDGLEKVAHDKGFDKGEKEHDAADSPLADYGVKDISNTRLSGGLAGVIGVGVTVVAGTAVFWAVRRRRDGDGTESGPASTATDDVTAATATAATSTTSATSVTKPAENA